MTWKQRAVEETAELIGAFGEEAHDLWSSLESEAFDFLDGWCDHCKPPGGDDQ